MRGAFVEVTEREDYLRGALERIGHEGFYIGNRFINVSVTKMIHFVITNDLVRITTKAYDFL